MHVMFHAMSEHDVGCAVGVLYVAIRLVLWVASRLVLCSAIHVSGNYIAWALFLGALVSWQGFSDLCV
jgi:hypothetical protein